MLDEIKEFFASNWDCLLMVCLICVMAVVISGCAMDAPIGAKYQPSTSSGQYFVNDLKSASGNLDQAVQVGALKYDDPAPVCLRNALARFGDEQDTFVPQINGAVSLASIAYIKAKQLENRAPVSAECKEVIGDIIIRRMSPL